MNFDRYKDKYYELLDQGMSSGDAERKAYIDHYQGMVDREVAAKRAARPQKLDKKLESYDLTPIYYLVQTVSVLAQVLKLTRLCPRPRGQV